MSECYAVAVGRKPGIYPTWDEAEIHVKGYPGAMYKKFKTANAAKRFIENSSYGEKQFSKKPTPKKKSCFLPNKIPQREVNPLQLESFYNGEKPPWEYPEYIYCIEGLLQESIDRLDLSESVVCWFQ